GLEDVHLRDEIRRDVLERQRAADTREYVAPVPGRRDIGQTADDDAVRLAAATVRDLYARHALQRFDDVVVRQLADVLRDDRFDDLNRFTLVLEAGSQ